MTQPFGKDLQDSIRHLFYSEKCLRHVLLPLLTSGFLTCRATKSFERASRQVQQLQIVRKKYKNVNFLPLQGFQPDWEATTTILSDDWKAMTSLACLLHFDGDVATMVRWISGPHKRGRSCPATRLSFGVDRKNEFLELFFAMGVICSKMPF